MMKVRPATMDDAADLFEWRNDPLTVHFSKSQDPVLYSDHIAWLERTLKDSNRSLLIGMLGHQKIGTVRFDLLVEKSALMTSITVAPSERGCGYASKLLNAALDHTGDHTYYAEIKKQNAVSRSLFKKAGFQYLYDSEPEIGLYRKNATGR